MEITRWSPFHEFTDLRREMDKLFDEFFGRRTPPEKKEKDFPAPKGYFPPIDIYKRGEDIVIKVGIPGVKKEDVNISILGNSLTIRGERRRDEEVKDEDFYHLEHNYGVFSRTITLPVGIAPEEMKAYYQDGILRVVLPRLKKVGA